MLPEPESFAAISSKHPRPAAPKGRYKTRWEVGGWEANVYERRKTTTIHVRNVTYTVPYVRLITNKYGVDYHSCHADRNNIKLKKNREYGMGEKIVSIILCIL